MLKAYLAAQQQELQALGQERCRLQEHLAREQRRQTRLADCCEHLGMGMGMGMGMPHALMLQNLSGMRQQVGRLMQHQQTQAQLAQADLARHERLVQQQLGRVKRLEWQLAERERRQRQQRLRQEQRQQDELAALRLAYRSENG